MFTSVLNENPLSSMHKRDGVEAPLKVAPTPLSHHVQQKCKGLGVEISHAHTMTSNGEAKQYPENPGVILLVQ
jgi:hypothetical protein